MKNFVIKTTAVSLGLALMGWLVFTLALPEYYLPVLPFLLVLFYLVTIAIHAYQLKVLKKDIAKFTRFNMLATLFKLLLYSVVAVVYIAIDSSNALPFVVSLMILYVIFSFIEVKELTKLTRK
jgi:hypothetical protein